MSAVIERLAPRATTTGGLEWPPSVVMRPAELQGLSHVEWQVAQAVALLGNRATWQVLTGLLSSLGHLEHYRSVELRAVLNKLEALDIVTSSYGAEMSWAVTEPFSQVLYADALDGTPLNELQSAMNSAVCYSGTSAYGFSRLPELPERASMLRLALFTNTRTRDFDSMRQVLTKDHRVGSDQLMALACFNVLTPPLLVRMAPAMQIAVLEWRLSRTALFDAALDEQLLEMLRKQAYRSTAATDRLFAGVAEQLLQRNRLAEALDVATHLCEKSRTLVQGAAWAQRNEWARAQASFDSVLGAPGQAPTGEDPGGLTHHYLLCLLAQATPATLLRAHSFCEAKTAPMPLHVGTDLGCWAHAIAVRQGRQTVSEAAFCLKGAVDELHSDNVYRTLLRAWLGQSVLPRGTQSLEDGERVKTLIASLRKTQHLWLADVLQTADAVWHGDAAPANFFCKEDPQAWKSVLGAVTRLADSVTPQDSAQAQVQPQARILWQLDINKEGAVVGVTPRQQKRGVRGNWNKSQPSTLAKVAHFSGALAVDRDIAATRVAPRSHDAYGTVYTHGAGELDLARVVPALVGHPCLVLKNAPDELVTLGRGALRIETVQEGDSFVLQVEPALRTQRVPYTQGQDIGALERMTVMRDEADPTHLQLVEMTPIEHDLARQTHRRVRVPLAAREELDRLLNRLSTKREVRADHLPTDAEVPAETVVRGELSRSGEGLALRLRMAPLGPTGPRFLPGEGRARVVVRDASGSTGTHRDLAAEKALVERIEQSLPMLKEAFQVDGEWHVGAPQSALEMADLLSQMPELVAIDWPKGQPVRMVRAGLSQFSMSVASGRDWLQMTGGVQLDEAQVMSLKELIATSGTQRYVPLGNGAYAALTDELRAKVRELSTVAETTRAGEVVVTALAASWLDELLDGVASEVDPAFSSKVERLRRAQATEVVAVPSELKAELRPYQLEGYQWAMHLARAGFGGCLADDMGLGKTLQAIAVLLARASQGAALVVAPTSVVGNWSKELERFAPTLKVARYGIDTFDLTELGANHVVVVSYGLLQRNVESFAQHKWASVVLDEAHAIKNPGTKRTQTVLALDAEFRLSLTGTPMENGATDMWSQMRFCNPGLLGSLKRFNERFVNPLEEDSTGVAAKTLSRLIAPFVLRRLKKDVLTELPPCTEVVMDVVPDEHEAAYYEALRRHAVEQSLAAREERGHKANATVFAHLTRLRQAACDPRLVTPGQPVGAKLQTFMKLVSELAANGHRTLVFSNFVEELKLVEDLLSHAGLRYQTLYGSTTQRARDRRVEAFQQGNDDVFLISMKAGGTGLNITEADYVVLLDPWWNPFVEDQAVGRAHRMGQTRAVTVYRLITKGTVEEGIVGMHERKRLLASNVLDGASAEKSLSVEEMLALMQG
jgi:superfamily II DNA or RNA helicase